MKFLFSNLFKLKTTFRSSYFIYQLNNSLTSYSKIKNPVNLFYNHIKYSSLKDAENLLINILQNNPRKGEKQQPLFNVLINSYAKINKPKECERIFKEMINNNITPDQITYNSIINSYARTLEPRM